MPTGYTAPVADGTLTDLRDFVVRCAHAFFPDDGSGLGSPLSIQVADRSGYHDDQLRRLRHELGTLREMSREEVDEAWKKEVESERESHRKFQEKLDLENARIQKMTDEVEAWEPPLYDMKKLKYFMLDQLRLSVHSPYYFPDNKKDQDSVRWYEDRVERLQKDIAYHGEAIAKSQIEAQWRNSWIESIETTFQTREKRCPDGTPRRLVRAQVSGGQETGTGLRTEDHRASTTR
jgi:hypothetical protein